jgi:hypothetical protein
MLILSSRLSSIPVPQIIFGLEPTSLFTKSAISPISSIVISLVPEVILSKIFSVPWISLSFNNGDVKAC